MSGRPASTAPDDEGTVLVGRVLRPHGLHGEVVVETRTDNPERFAPGARLDAGPAGELEVAAARPHRGALLVRFAGVDDRDAADALRGRELAVPAEAVPEAPEGTYYHFQLLGCRVVDAADGELGEVVDLAEDGGGLILVVEGEAPGGGLRRVPVPFVAALLRRVDVEGKEIEVELPEGLVEACASRS